ncbi:7-cyano-7-deazaguanine synthase [Salmonella enterica]|nr:7-cyano-7-deazaguanine synthase [Salmonella enterica]ELF7042862.1 7-cyano-7-deazaguanine synthase [Salmonella enterica]
MVFGNEFLHPGYSGNNPFNSKEIRYLIKKSNGWIYASLEEAISSPVRVDFESLISQIIFGRSAGKTSLLHDVECIVPGFSFKINQTSNNSLVTEFFEWEDFLTSHESTDSPAEMLYQFVSDVVTQSNASHFIIRLSGGLDSTGILLALIESVDTNKIIALTYSYKTGSSNEDEKAAKKLCAEYGIKLIIVEYEPHLLFHKLDTPVSPVLNMRVINHKMYEKEINLIKNNCDGNFVIFDGHGGDHVFCERIPPSLPKELFLSAHPVKAIKALLRMSRIYGCSIKDILYMQTSETKSIFKEAYSFFLPQALSHIKTMNKTILDDRKSVLSDAIIDNSTAMTLETSVYDVFPFTNAEMIHYGFNLKIEDSFNSIHRRLQYRKSIQKRFNFRFTRRDKGHITGAYQEALKINKKRVLGLIKNGQFASHNMIDISKIENAIETASRGVGGLSSVIIRIIAAEIILEGYTK